VYINDLPELCASQDDSSKLYFYADDAKIFKAVSQITDQLVRRSASAQATLC